ncbi:hypothetical protein EG850_10950 [Gulosibacter macacae]|uniref:Tape measure protein N-terminal domain-containing protein n=1 Tax=Gulosibacter macacae TaxID=2488791 RepID=A0A3P3VWS0_9MICO|nr:tape measure protein [Gulosibacter macacae]RRJ85899.1 hypothetical protein EG850_10950 [Gulosibacter macacae]
MRGASRQITAELAGVDVKGVGSKLGQELSGAIGKGLNLQAVGAKISQWGDAATAVGSKLTNGITKPALAAATAVAGIFAVSGWNRLVAIDTARAKLKGLKMSAEDIDAVMANALASVKGTAFGLGEAATTAAGAVAAGIKPGQDLERTLKLVADTASVAGTDMNEMGAIFNKVAATGKLNGEVIAQLSERGVAVLPALAEHLGITTEEVMKLGSEGKISFETFQEAMEGAVGGAAGIMGAESMVAAWDNVKAAIGRAGAAFLDAGGEGGGFFSQIKPLLVEFTGMIDDLTPKAEELGIAFGRMLATAVEHIRTLIGWWQGLDPQIQRTIGIVAGIAVAAGPVLLLLGKIAGAVGGAISAVGTLSAAIGGIGAGGAAAGGAAGIGSKIATLLGPIGMVIGLVTALIAASPELREALGGAFGAIGSVLGELFTALAPVVQDLFAQLAPIFGTLGGLLGEVIVALTPLIEMLGPILVPIVRALAAVLTPVISILVAILDPIIGLVSWVLDLITPLIDLGAAFLMEGAEWLAGILTDYVVPALQWVADGVEVVTDWFKSLGDSSTEAGQGFQDVWGGLTEFFQGVWDGITGVFTWAWETVIAPILDLFAFVLSTILMPVIQAWWNVNSFVWNAVAGVIGWVWNTILAPIFDLIAFVFNTILMPVFMAFWNTVSFVWTAIQVALAIAWGVIGAIFRGIVDFVRNTLGVAFTWLYENVIKPVWDGIQSVIRPVADWFTANVVPAFDSATSKIGGAFDTLKDAIGKAWDAIKRAAVGPVNFVINTVYNDGIKALFDQIAEAVGLDIRMPTATPIKLASGGVLPGYTPGRDVHRFYSPTGGLLHLSGGEGIIRPDALRALGGKAWLDRVNSARGDAGRVPAFAFADGGVWDWIGETVSGALGFFAEATNAAMDIISDPLGAIKNLIVEPVRNLLGGIGGGIFGDILTGVPNMVIGWLEDLLKGSIAQSAVIDGYRGGPTLARLAPIIAKHGLVVTDTYGDPAYNASLGRSPTSYHGDWDNPAVDIAGSQAAMFAAADEIIAMGGWRQILWQVAGHYDHIHVANQGGIWPGPKLYDEGGWLQPGLTMAYNATGKPEPVLTSEQWDRMQGGVTIQQTNYMPQTDANVVGDRLAAAAARGLVGVDA